MLSQLVGGRPMDSRNCYTNSNSRYLASASDDETIRIWKRDESYVWSSWLCYIESRGKEERR